jgi:glycosyltransferase involved in cell wall biosynthesis
MKQYSLIIPVYKNEGTILALLDAIERIDDAMDKKLEAVFVVDGSPDRCHEILRRELPSRRFASQLALLSRNFGAFAAIRTGLSIANGPLYAVMAADLQEPPELVVEFFKTLATGDYDMTLGVRARRSDPSSSLLMSRLFWVAYRKFIQPEMPPGGVDVFGCNKVVRDLLVELKEANSTLVGLIVWAGFRKKLISYDRLPRAEGESAWTFRKKWAYMMNSAYAFTALPIALLMGTGVFGVGFSIVFGLMAIVARLLGRIDVPGYTAIVLLLLFCTSLILIGLGIVGGYVWRAFENTKDRPQFIMLVNEKFNDG